MIKRLTIFYNENDDHADLRKMAEQTGLDSTFLPTSGTYTLWTRLEDNSIGEVSYGPTAVKRLLSSLIEKKVA